MMSSSNDKRMLLLTTALLGAAPAVGCGGGAPSEEGNVGEASAAVTLSGYEVVSDETAVNTTTSKQIQVECPSGKKALGAGWAVLDEGDGILEGIATYSSASWDGASWLTNAKNLSGFSPEWKLKVTVLCADEELSGYEIVTDESAVDTTVKKQLNLECPENKTATGAGWAVLDEGNAILEGEALYFLPGWDGASWLMNAKNNSGFSPEWKLAGQIICANISALSGYEVTTDSTATNSWSMKQLNLGCPEDKFATGAGWAVLDEGDGILDGAATYFLPGWDGASWLTNAKNYNTNFAPDWKLTVRALCVD